MSNKIEEIIRTISEWTASGALKWQRVDATMVYVDGFSTGKSSIRISLRHEADRTDLMMQARLLNQGVAVHPEQLKKYYTLSVVEFDQEEKPINTMALISTRELPGFEEPLSRLFNDIQADISLSPDAADSVLNLFKRA